MKKNDGEFRSLWSILGPGPSLAMLVVVGVFLSSYTLFAMDGYRNKTCRPGMVFNPNNGFSCEETRKGALLDDNGYRIVCFCPEEKP